MRLVAEEAQPDMPVSAFRVNLQALSRRLGRPGEGLRRLQVPHGLCDLQFQQPGRIAAGGCAQDQDRGLDPGTAQLPRLLQARYRQVLRAQRLQPLCHRNGSVAIGVGLHHAQKAAIPRQQSPKRTVVMFQIGQIDLCPSTHLHIVHSLTPLLPVWILLYYASARSTSPKKQKAAAPHAAVSGSRPSFIIF